MIEFLTVYSVICYLIVGALVYFTYKSEKKFDSSYIVIALFSPVTIWLILYFGIFWKGSLSCQLAMEIE